MDQLLRDGGDIDSMDRSLLDYGANRSNIVIRTNGDGTLSPPATFSPPFHQQQQSQNLSVGVTITPPGSPMSPVASPANGTASPVPPDPSVVIMQQQQQQQNCNVMSNLVKKDLVVRFTEFQNSVQHVTSATAPAAAASRGSERPMTSSGGQDIAMCRLASHDQAKNNFEETYDEDLQRFHEGKENDPTVKSSFVQITYFLFLANHILLTSVLLDLFYILLHFYFY